MNDGRINTGIDLAVDGARVFADDVRELADFQKAARPLRDGGIDGVVLHWFTSLACDCIAAR